EMLLDSFSDEDFKKFSPIRFLFESETVARQLLGDCASALSDVAGDKVFQGRAHDAKEIVAAVLIKVGVYHCYHGVHQVARQLLIGDGLAVFDIDLAKNFSV